MHENKHDLSIGEVAAATGVSVYTLRQWERRYGNPQPIKKGSGHRRYSLKDIARLRLVSQVLLLGQRANKVVPLCYDELLKILNELDQSSPILAVEKWLQCVKLWDQNQLMKYCHSDWDTLGPLELLKQRVIPFLTRIGESWLLNEISVAQEHFFSELLESFLSEKWRRLNQTNSGPAFVLASPEGEGHRLGLHMCALILSLNKKKIVFLGASTPYEDIVLTSQKASAQAVCLSFSSFYSHPQLDEKLERLNVELGGSTKLVIGGNGAPKATDGIFRFNNFDNFSKWISTSHPAAHS